MAVGSTGWRCLKNLKTARRITTLRPERGYSATKYDGSLARIRKTLRRHSGRLYDQKKVRNSKLRVVETFSKQDQKAVVRMIDALAFKHAKAT